MAGSALRRLMAEYKRKITIDVFMKYPNDVNFLIYMFHTITELTLNPPEGIVAGPINEENFFDWEALIVYEPSNFR